MTFNPGDVGTVDFTGVTGVKRRPAVVLSSAAYHATRPDMIGGRFTGCVCFPKLPEKNID